MFPKGSSSIGDNSMKRKWIQKLAAGLLAALFLTTPCFAATIGGATVTGSSVRLRATADTSSTANIITEMTEGTFLLVEETLPGWYRVVSNGVEGFVSSDYADFSETRDGTFDFKATTNGTNVNMRSLATTSSAVIKTIANTGTALTVTGVSGEWLKVLDASGAEGYIRSDLVNYSGGAVTAQVTVPQTKGQAIVQTAQKYLGYAYSWGGTSPSTGFDCSGFANYVCKQNGITLHRVAQDVYSNDGVWVSKDQIQPGDLLFFGYGPYSVTHMGIYVGNGQMIHASTSSTGVIYSDINSNYYTRMYVGAKRVA